MDSVPILTGKFQSDFGSYDRSAIRRINPFDSTPWLQMKNWLSHERLRSAFNIAGYMCDDDHLHWFIGRKAKAPCRVCSKERTSALPAVRFESAGHQVQIGARRD